MDTQGLFIPSRQIPHEHLIQVCKYRQGESCCRYIFVPREENEFYCVKKISKIREQLDGEVEEMTAKGDNCPGL